MLSSEQNVEDRQPPGVSVTPRQRATHPATLLTAPPPQSSEPPTLGKGAIRDVEGTHGDTHEDQEFKKPKPARDMKGKLSGGIDIRNQSRGSPEPPPEVLGEMKGHDEGACS